MANQRSARFRVLTVLNVVHLVLFATAVSRTENMVTPNIVCILMVALQFENIADGTYISQFTAPYALFPSLIQPIAFAH